MSKPKPTPDMCVGAAHLDLGKLVHSALGGEKRGTLGECEYGSPVFYKCMDDSDFVGDVPIYTSMKSAAMLPDKLQVDGKTCVRDVDQVFA